MQYLQDPMANQAIQDLAHPMKRRRALQTILTNFGDAYLAFNPDSTLNPDATARYILMKVHNDPSRLQGFENTSFLVSVLMNSWPSPSVHNPFNLNEVLPNGKGHTEGVDYSDWPEEALQFVYLAHTSNTGLFDGLGNRWRGATARDRLQSIDQAHDRLEAAKQLCIQEGLIGFWEYFQDRLRLGQAHADGALPLLWATQWPQRFPKPDPRPMATSYTSGSVAGDVRSSVHRLVGEDRLDEALKVLGRHFSGDAHQSRQVTLLVARLSGLRRDQISGGVSRENMSLTRNQIVKAILDLVG